MPSSIENPLVSIVVPAYNADQYLKEAIDSVLSQSYDEVELLVFDDGSTDRTREILEGYEQDNFYWESHQNIGQAATLNKGWRMSKGSILSYLSADDVLKPDAIERSVEFLLQHQDIILSYGDYELIDHKSVPMQLVQAPEFNYPDMVSNIIVQPGPGVFFRRSAFEEMGGWDDSLRQIPDYEYWLRIGLLGNFKRIPLILADYRVHEGSQTYIESSVDKAEECVRVMTNYYLRSDIPPDIIQLEGKSKSSAHIISARLHLRSARYKQMWKHLRQAWIFSKKNTLSFRTLQLIGNGIAFRISRRFNKLISISDH